MTGSLRQAWDYFPAEIWDSLAEYSSKDVSAPQELFNDLFALASDYLSPGPTATELEEARNDPEAARQYFFILRGGDFLSESGIVRFLEEAHEVVADYDIPGFEDLYRRLLRAVFKKLNLRYRLDDPFVVRFMLPGSFANMYTEIQRINSTNAHPAGLLDDFEKAFDRYARTQDPTDLKTCIGKASNTVARPFSSLRHLTQQFTRSCLGGRNTFADSICKTQQTSKDCPRSIQNAATVVCMGKEDTASGHENLTFTPTALRTSRGMQGMGPWGLLEENRFSRQPFVAIEAFGQSDGETKRLTNVGDNYVRLNVS
jgi:hypothetical protein